MLSLNSNLEVTKLEVDTKFDKAIMYRSFRIRR